MFLLFFCKFIKESHNDGRDPRKLPVRGGAEELFAARFSVFRLASPVSQALLLPSTETRYVCVHIARHDGVTKSNLFVAFRAHASTNEHFGWKALCLKT